MVAYNLRKVENRDRYPDPPHVFIFWRTHRAKHRVTRQTSRRTDEWPSGLRRSTQVRVSSEAWVRTPLHPCLVFWAAFTRATANTRGVVQSMSRLAQLVERKTFNLVVVGSSPTVGGHYFFLLPASVPGHPGKYGHVLLATPCVSPLPPSNNLPRARTLTARRHRHFGRVVKALAC